MKTAKPLSVFSAAGMANTLAALKREIQELYQADNVPWIIGYSGGKDSTAVLQIIWMAISELPPERRTKTIHIISTDTLVENPIVAAWVENSHAAIRTKAASKELPMLPHRLSPSVENSFWVNLIGKGYPAPRHKFRWCTERLKISPSNAFINSITAESGEAILVLGSRKAESQRRQRTMAEHEAASRVQDDPRKYLTRNSSLPSTLVYTPIEDWSNDDVWLFLMQVKNPWGFDNKDLLTMYQGASPDGECPLVVDSSTPSCGDSRFGCWVCTMVDQDKSMTAMIQNDQEKEWMMPLLELRNALDFRNMSQGDEESSDRHIRDFRRMSGNVMLFGGRLVHGPYTQEAREQWLRKLLSAQAWIRRNGPKEVRQISLISLEELQEIRRIWVVEKHEMEDNLPRIYEEVTGETYPGARLDDNPIFKREEMQLLRDLCGENQMHFQLVRELLSIERQQRAHVRRRGLFESLEKAISRHFYKDEADALDMAKRYTSARDKATKGERAVAFTELPLDFGQTDADVKI
jgi:DNA sulfur modification protein DndC